MAYKLYTIDTGSEPFDENASEIRPYRRQLLLLSEKCTNPEIHLGDAAVAVQNRLKEAFVDVTVLRILEVVAYRVSDATPGDCDMAYAETGVAFENAG